MIIIYGLMLSPFVGSLVVVPVIFGYRRVKRHIERKRGP
jgi:asparagine N-glycosylation enzyme membrane subunit Stt3